MIANAIVEDPVNPRLPLTMCKLLKHEERYEEALALVDALPPNIRSNREIEQLNAALGFYRDIDARRDMNFMIGHIASHPDDVGAKQQLIAHYVIQEQYESALQELVGIINIDPDYQDNYARKAMLRVFTILGSEHALVSEYRPNLKRYSH